jgi:Ca2+-binding EF-hand superfamily protein
LTALGVTAVLLAGCGHEKPPPGGYWNPYASPEKPRDENYHGGPEALLLRYDANKDGTLTRAELIAGLKAEFATHDTNHTGCLPEDEVAAINQERVNQDQSTATPLIDWNHDGCLDYSEFSALAYSARSHPRNFIRTPSRAPSPNCRVSSSAAVAGAAAAEHHLHNNAARRCLTG